ncbi:Dienelactone hydrolase [Penicillium expansum]|uniref:Dienelactone hydrolase n=1 Tax=Penicillium expansum TaxID=27334 RepID=A0A0A2JJG1_PENEN|nr:Dienelactone hydrolase [Penicillium expansum]KGO40374.1 Dienelactone hydrolase [Penicillium expansum]KGO54961.1 Dienelactone hydrolase [Penicillium expansum]KGO70495.1 Dienelactone hydrolase [Penicillium expansum]
MASQACCNTPPKGEPAVVSEDQIDQAAGVNLYVFGDRKAKRGVVLVYDIFGLYPQTKQGAALLAKELDCLVIIPDFFNGEAANIEWVGMDTAEKRDNMMGFFANKASPEKNLATLYSVTNETKSLYATVEKWAVLGLCWGGKLAALASTDQTPFVASGQTHPALLDIADARRMAIPHICLVSPDEPADILNPYKEALPDHSEFELYGTMFHGWMGARANLEDEKNLLEFTRGYKQVAAFFKRWL